MSNYEPGADVSRFDAAEVAYLEGELDYFAAEELGEKVPVRGRPVVVDLSRLKFIDAGGVGALEQLRDEVIASGGELRLVNASGNVRRVFELTNRADLLAA